MHTNGYTAAPAPSTLAAGAYVLLPADDPRLAPRQSVDYTPPAPPASPLLLTIPATAEALSLSESTVRELMRRRDDPLPSVKISTARRVRRDELVAWLDREAARGRR